MNYIRRKIILITLRSDIGGGPYHIDLLLKNLVTNFDFYIASPLNDPYGFQWQQLVGKNNFFEMPFRSFKINKFIKLIYFVKSNSINIVHSHGKGAGLYSRLLKIFIPGIKVVHTFHGIHIQQYNSVQSKFYIYFERLMNFLTDQLINVSIGEQKICQSYKLFNKKKSRIIYNGIHPVAHPSKSKTELRHSLSLPKDKFLIISILRFNYQKNLPLIINLADRLKENMRFYFLIIGDGEQREEVESVILQKKLSNINLLGFKKNVTEYLFASDIFLSTSLWEGLPYSLIEATACGLPIIASDVTGNNEVVSENENGFLFPLNDPDLAVKKILQLESSIDLQKIMSKHSLKIFENKFQIKTMIEKNMDTYIKLSNSLKESL